MVMTIFVRVYHSLKGVLTSLVIISNLGRSQISAVNTPHKVSWKSEKRMFIIIIMIFAGCTFDNFDWVAKQKKYTYIDFRALCAHSVYLDWVENQKKFVYDDFCMLCVNINNLD